MGVPQSPRAWIRYAAHVLEAQSVPFSKRFDDPPRGDPRMRDSRETAISVKIMLERSANGCRGRGPRLLVRLYLGSEPWDCFTDREKRLIRKTERRFRRELVAAGFLPDPDQLDLPR